MMRTPPYERLTAQDSAFLAMESGTTPMHVSVVAILEAAPLLASDGRIDAERVARHLESRLHAMPRLRQKLGWTPLERHPVWIDDQRFDVRRHLRCADLPPPGSEYALRRLVGRVLAVPLERGRPLWELWLVSGLEGGRVALVCKLHHSMVDGVAGMNLLAALFRADADLRHEPALRWTARRAPSTARLVLDDTRRHAARWPGLLRAGQRALEDPRAAAARASDVATALLDTAREGLRWPVATGHNGSLGASRRVEWLTLPFEEIREIKRVLGGTVNDALLAIVTGGLRAFLGERGVDLHPRRARPYRVLVPVSLRVPHDGADGNHTSLHFAELPLDAATPLERHARVCSELARAKAARSAEGLALLMRFADWAGLDGAARAGARLAARLHPYNLIVTNLVGPPVPLYLCGARLLALYPGLPLFAHQGLGVAALSYAEQLCLELVADPALLPDLDALAREVEESYRELRRTARERSSALRGPARIYPFSGAASAAPGSPV